MLQYRQEIEGGAPKCLSKSPFGLLHVFQIANKNIYRCNSCRRSKSLYRATHSVGNRLLRILPICPLIQSAKSMNCYLVTRLWISPVRGILRMSGFAAILTVIGIFRYPPNWGFLRNSQPRLRRYFFELKGEVVFHGLTLEVTGPPLLRRNRLVQVWFRVGRLVRPHRATLTRQSRVDQRRMTRCPF